MLLSAHREGVPLHTERGEVRLEVKLGWRRRRGRGSALTGTPCGDMFAPTIRPRLGRPAAPLSMPLATSRTAAITSLPCSGALGCTARPLSPSLLLPAGSRHLPYNPSRPIPFMGSRNRVSSLYPRPRSGSSHPWVTASAGIGRVLALLPSRLCCGSAVPSRDITPGSISPTVYPGRPRTR